MGANVVEIAVDMHVSMGSSEEVICETIIEMAEVPGDMGRQME